MLLTLIINVQRWTTLGSAETEVKPFEIFAIEDIGIFVAKLSSTLKVFMSYDSREHSRSSSSKLVVGIFSMFTNSEPYVCFNLSMTFRLVFGRSSLNETPQ